MDDDLIGTTLAVAASAAVFGFVVFSFVLAVPIVITATGGWVFYKLKVDSPAAKEKKAYALTHQLYRQVKASVNTAPSKQEFGKQVYQHIPASLPEDLEDQLIESALDLYDAESFETDVPSPPGVCNSIEGARYRDFLSQYSAKMSDPASAKIAVDIIAQAYGKLLNHVPHLETSEEDVLFTVPLSYFIGENVGVAIEEMILTFFSEEAKQLNLFQDLREVLDENLHRASGFTHMPYPRQDDKLVFPSDYEGENIVYAYLAGTPFLAVLDFPVPLDISQKKRFEHMFVVGGTGHGKTSVFETFLMRDINAVAELEASVVLIDSQRSLINKVKQLKLFAPGHPLFHRLILVEPRDIAYPLAANIFRADYHSMADDIKESYVSDIIDIFEYIFTALLDAEMTERQSNLFNYAVRLLVTIPESTIYSFIDLFTTDKQGRFVNQATYAPYIEKLDADARQFYENDFLYDYKDTKVQVRARLRGVLSQKTIGRMLSNPDNKLNLASELDAGCVVLVDTDENLLKGRGSAFLGCFFIGLIHQVSTARANYSDSELMPTFVYIDEFADYAKNANDKIDKILAQARKRKIGMVTAFQQFSKLSQQLQDSIISLSSIRMAGGCERESNLVARSLHTTPEFIDSQSVLTFASWIKGTTESAIPLRFRPDEIGKQPKMTKEEALSVKELQREYFRSEWTESNDALFEEEDDNEVDSETNTESESESAESMKPAKAAEDPGEYRSTRNTQNKPSVKQSKKKPKVKPHESSTDQSLDDPDNPSVEPSDEL